jgi:hypothetical protein
LLFSPFAFRLFLIKFNGVMLDMNNGLLKEVISFSNKGRSYLIKP